MKCIIRFIKYIKNKLLYSFRADSKTYIKYLKKRGVKIGHNTYFVSAKDTWIDDQKPWMISIGKNCVITSGCIVLSHDYSWIVLKNLYGDIIGNVKKTVIGDNCFIGINSTILCGTHIGNNVIIGANSTVSGMVPDNCVIAGNPAKVICSLEEFKNKRYKVFYQETENMGIEYYDRYKKDIPKTYLKEHFFAFENEVNNLENEFKNEVDSEIVESSLNKNTPYWLGYDEFIKYCRLRGNINE